MVTEQFELSPLSWRAGSEGTVSPLSLAWPGAGMGAGNGPIQEKTSSLGHSTENSLNSCLGAVPFPLLPAQPCPWGILGTLSSLGALSPGWGGLEGFGGRRELEPPCSQFL